MKDLDAYLSRIGLAARPAPTLAGLRAIHEAHAFAIPFENLDIILGRGIDLDPPAIEDKLVRRRRGGYCFEQNALLGLALRALGFEVRDLIARVVVKGGGPEAAARTHQLLLVSIAGGLWIADVGFGGDGLRGPLFLSTGAATVQHSEEFRLGSAGVHGLMLQRRGEGGWVDQYVFTLEARYPVDFRVANHFTASHPSSFFTLRRTVSLPNPEGRRALLDAEASLRSGAGLRSWIIEDAAEYRRRLREDFALELSADEAERLFAASPDQA